MPETTTNDGTTLVHRDSGGEGLPLVMLHSWGQSQEFFHHQLTGLSPNRRAITLDLRGHGRSGKPRHGTGRIRRFVIVDQPAAVTAVPWMTAEEHRDSGAGYDVAEFLALVNEQIGSEGSHVNPDSQRFVARRIPNARVHTFPTDGANSHHPFAGNPAAFNAWSTSS